MPSYLSDENAEEMKVEATSMSPMAPEGAYLHITRVVPYQSNNGDGWLPTRKIVAYALMYVT